MEISALSDDMKRFEQRKVFKATSIVAQEFIVINDICVLPACAKLFSEDSTSGFIQYGRGLVEGVNLLNADGQVQVNSIQYIETADPLTLSLPYVKGASFICVQDVCVRQDSLVPEDTEEVPGGCVVAGTLISLPEGAAKKVEDLQIGDVVLSYNEYTHIVENKRVLGIDAPIVDRKLTLLLSSGESLGLTLSQPIYLRKPGTGVGWASYLPDRTRRSHPYLTKVLKVSAGDFVKAVNGTWVQIKSIIETPGQFQVYNIWAVEDNRSYFASGVLLHNKGSFISTSTTISTTGLSVAPISDLKIGDQVLSYSEYDGSLETSIVRGITSTTVSKYWSILTISGKTLEISEEQLVFARSGPGEEGWRAINAEAAAKAYPYIKHIRSLRPEDELYTSARSWCPILAIDEVSGQAKESVTVWDVAQNMTLFANEFLVHNKSSVPCPDELAIPVPSAPLLPTTVVRTGLSKDSTTQASIDIQPGSKVLTTCGCPDTKVPIILEEAVQDVTVVNSCDYYSVCVQDSVGNTHIINALPYQIFWGDGTDPLKDYMAIDVSQAAQYFPTFDVLSPLMPGSRIWLTREIWGEVLYVTKQRGDIQCVQIHT